MRPRTLVAGIGNIFLGDDGFGCEVARTLAGSYLPEGVRVVDYGIRGMHLAYDLLERWDLFVLIDALPDRGSPGRLEIIELRPEHLGAAELDAHCMVPVTVLASLGALGGQLPPSVLVGAQVADIGDRMGLSTELADAVPMAVDAIQALLQTSPVHPTSAAARRRRSRAKVR